MNNLDKFGHSFDKLSDISAKRECAYENREVFFSGKKQKFLKSIRFKDFKIVFRLSHNKFCNFECFYLVEFKSYFDTWALSIYIHIMCCLLVSCF